MDYQALYAKPLTHWLTMPLSELNDITDQLLKAPATETLAECDKRLAFWSQLSKIWGDRLFAEISLNLEGPEGNNVVSLR